MENDMLTTCKGDRMSKRRAASQAAPSSPCHLVTSSPCRLSRARRGAAYVLVLGMGLLLAVVCYGVLMVTRLRGHDIQQSRDARDAELLAESAVQRAAQILANNSTTWRTTYTNNVETAQVTCGRGTISFKL